MKFRIVFFPFLLFSLSGIALYLLFFWLLKVEYTVISMSSDFIFFIPFFLSIVMVMLLSPYTNLLQYNNHKADTLLFFLMVMTIFIPMITGQSYIDKTFGKVTHLEKISDINQYPATKYYTVKQYYVDKSEIFHKTSYHVSGKRNQYFNINLFITSPIIDFETYFKVASPNIFLGIRHYREISNKLSDQEKQQESLTFINNCLRKFNEQDLNKFTYLERVEGKELAELQNAVCLKSGTLSAESHFFYAVDEPFDQRTGNSLSNLFLYFGLGAFFVFLMIRLADINEKYRQNITNHKFSYVQQLKTSSFLFFNFKNWFWQVLFYINLLAYIILVIKTGEIARLNITDLQAAGANHYPFILQGEWWRVITSMFLHGGIIHIITNLTALYCVGLFLQPYAHATPYGGIKFISVYLLCGIISGITGIIWNPEATGVGASGAILGWFGLFITFAVKGKLKKQYYDIMSLIVALIVVISTIVSGFFIPQIDNPAHLGGLITGIIVGLFATPPNITMKQRKLKKRR